MVNSDKEGDMGVEYCMNLWKGSKHDPILDAFMSGTEGLVTVKVPEKDTNYLRTQLNKRIEARRLRGVKVLVVNNTCYLEM